MPCLEWILGAKRRNKQHNESNVFYLFYFGLIARTGELLDLCREKIDMLVVNKAIQESLEGWDGAALVEWACADSPLLQDDANGKNSPC